MIQGQVYVDSSEIAQDGSFPFDRLDREKEYSLKFDESIDTENAQLYSVSDEGQKEITSSPDGFKVEPMMLLDPKEKSITMVLGSVKDDGNITMTKRAMDPYELTPPVDEKEEPIEVEPSVVNETVFEPAVEEEEEKPQSKVATAVLDDSDWRAMVGKGEVYETKRGYNLQFGFNEFLLSENQIEYIQKVVVPMLLKSPHMTLTIEGHTDSVGSDEVNYRMAVLRASNVLYHLEMAGIEDTRLNIIAKGESEPLAPNDLPEGRALNRRVELLKAQNNPK